MIGRAMPTHVLGEFANSPVNGQHGRRIRLFDGTVYRFNHCEPPDLFYTESVGGTATKSLNTVI